MNSNIINFNNNVPNNLGNQRNKNIAKNTRLNSMNITYNQKMSCESSYGNALNNTNINNTTSNNTLKNKNTLFANNKNDTETKKSLMTFVLDNNNEKNRISEYRNNKNKYYYKEESSNSSPYKNLKNLNININNQININNNNIINDLMPLKKNSKILEKKNYINKSNKKILLSRNKQNYLDFTSINSFLSSNSNYSNIRKNYLNKNENPIDILISSKNLNIKENNKTTLYYNNVNKSSNMNNYSYNKSSRKNNSSNIIKISNMKQNKNDVFKSLKNMTDKIYIKLKYKNFSNSRIINQKRESLGKKHLKKSSTYHILPK
jgi:E3 ubiquitin-protein ligase HUWE1